MQILLLWKTIIIVCYEFVFVALFVHAPCCIICGLSGCTKFFSTLSHKEQDFQEKLLNMKYVFWLSLQFVYNTFLILGRIQRDTVINDHT